MTSTELERAHVRDYLLAGNAVVTLENRATGGRFTFRVEAPRKETERGGLTRDWEARVRFVSVLTGPENTTDYTFLGTLFLDSGDYRRSRKSRVSAEAPSARAWTWFWERLNSGRGLPAALSVHHSGRCGRCGRELTVPESLRLGLGPECAGRI